MREKKIVKKEKQQLVLQLSNLMNTGSMEHLYGKLRYDRLQKNRNVDLTAFAIFQALLFLKLSGTIERKVAVSFKARTIFIITKG